MNIYSNEYREIKRLYQLSDVAAKEKKELLIFENKVNQRKSYVVRCTDSNLVRNVEFTEKEFLEMLSKVMEENNFKTVDNINDFLQINYGESLEKTLERI